MPAAAQAADALIESGLAYSVIHGPYALAVGSLFNLFSEVLLGVQDHVVCAGLLGQLGLLLGGHGGENEPAQLLDHLGQKQTHAAGPSVDDHSVAFLHSVGGVAQIVGGHTLKDGRGPCFGVNAAGTFHQPPCGHNGQLGVGTGSGAIGNVVPNLDLSHAGADIFDNPCALHTDDAGQRRAGVHALAAINICKVHACGLDLDNGFSLAGSRVGHVLVLHDLGSAEFSDLYCFHIEPS